MPFVLFCVEASLFTTEVAGLGIAVGLARLDPFVFFRRPRDPLLFANVAWRRGIRSLNAFVDDRGRVNEVDAREDASVAFDVTFGDPVTVFIA